MRRIASFGICQQLINRLTGERNRRQLLTIAIQWPLDQSLRIYPTSQSPARTMVLHVAGKIVDPDQEPVSQTSQLKVAVKILLYIKGSGLLVFIVKVLVKKAITRLISPYIAIDPIRLHVAHGNHSL
ncbi:hypothetical protein D3C72_1089410 [compost metagenome]